MDWFIYDNGLHHERVKIYGHVPNTIILVAATGGALWKKVFLKISQNLQENIFVGVCFWYRAVK